MKQIINDHRSERMYDETRMQKIADGGGAHLYITGKDVLFTSHCGSMVETEDILTGTDFFSAVWNKTLGNALPFIFQPDNTNANLDQFAICKFVGDSLTYNQVANNVYNIKLKIEEVW